MYITKQKNIVTLILIVILLVACTTKQSSNQTELDTTQDVAKEVSANGILEISKYGNVKINLEHSKVLDAFEYGDILTISFGDVSVDAPLCRSFSDVDSGCPGLFLQMDGDIEETELAINMGNFAQTYNIAEKIVHEDKSYEWQYFDGLSKDMRFNISLKEKAGYLEQFTIRSMAYTDAREDYNELSDEDFVNFRKVTAGQIGDGVLYRSSSLTNPEHGRNNCADTSAKNAGIDVFIDLADSDAAVLEYEGINDSYFISQKYIAVASSMDFTAKENCDKLAEALRFMIDNPGTYCIFCDEGKARTGIVIAILESLMDASYEEIAKDYMQSYVNYYKISPDDEVYDMILNGNLNKNLNSVLGVDPMNGNLKEAAQNYLISIGLTDEEITKLKNNLSVK